MGNEKIKRFNENNQNMKTIELTEKQAELLKELLSLDMERMGFDSEESDILEEISEKL